MIEEIVLGLLYLNVFDDYGATRAWKSLNLDALKKLYRKGYISDPFTRAKSVTVTNEGLDRGYEMARRYFSPDR
jgi:hypothetical protein